MATTNDPIPTIDVFVDKFRHLSPEEQAALLDRLAETRKEKTIADFFGIWASDPSTEDLARKIRETRSQNRERGSL